MLTDEDVRRIVREELERAQKRDPPRKKTAIGAQDRIAPDEPPAAIA